MSDTLSTLVKEVDTLVRQLEKKVAMNEKRKWKPVISGALSELREMVRYPHSTKTSDYRELLMSVYQAGYHAGRGKR